MSLSETRDMILLAEDEGLIDDDDFMLLFELNKSKNPPYPYWKYSKFDLDD